MASVRAGPVNRTRDLNAPGTRAAARPGTRRLSAAPCQRRILVYVDELMDVGASVRARTYTHDHPASRWIFIPPTGTSMLARAQGTRGLGVSFDLNSRHSVIRDHYSVIHVN